MRGLYWECYCVVEFYANKQKIQFQEYLEILKNELNRTRAEKGLDMADLTYRNDRVFDSYMILNEYASFCGIKLEEYLDRIFETMKEEGGAEIVKIIIEKREEKMQKWQKRKIAFLLFCAHLLVMIGVFLSFDGIAIESKLMHYTGLIILGIYLIFNRGGIYGALIAAVVLKYITDYSFGFCSALLLSSLYILTFLQFTICTIFALRDKEPSNGFKFILAQVPWISVVIISLALILNPNLDFTKRRDNIPLVENLSDINEYENDNVNIEGKYKCVAELDGEFVTTYWKFAEDKLYISANFSFDYSVEYEYGIFNDINGKTVLAIEGEEHTGAYELEIFDKRIKMFADDGTFELIKLE